MNIASTHMKSYFALVDHVREMQSRCKWTQKCALASWLLESMDPEEGFLDTSIPDLSLRAYKAAKKGKNPDLPTLREAMEGLHSKEFRATMEKETEELQAHGTWQGVVKSTIPKNAEIVPLTWVFRIKHLPNGELDKFKARLCVRGDLQAEERETYAPVV